MGKKLDGLKKLWGNSDDDFLDEEDNMENQEELTEDNISNLSFNPNDIKLSEDTADDEAHNSILFDEDFSESFASRFSNQINIEEENDEEMNNMNNSGMNMNGLGGRTGFDTNSYGGPTLFADPEPEENKEQVKQMVVLRQPKKFAEASSIADDMLVKKTIVLNTDSLSQDVRRRIVDFLSGVAYANGATIKKASNTTFVMTPDTVGIVGEESTGDDEDTNTSNSESLNNSDESF